MTTLFGIFTLAILRLLIPVAVILSIGEMAQRQKRMKKTR
jgi:hypothetical protein